MTFARFTSILVSTSLATSLAGCSAGDAAAPAPTTTKASLVGTLAGTDARVGLVVDDAKGVLYVCGGPTTRPSLSRWFSGGRSSTGLDWTSTDGLRVTASPRGDTWSGDLVTSDGARMHFDLAAAPAGTIAGLYEAKLAEGRAGVVVFQASSTEPATMLGTFQSIKGSFEQVLPVREVMVTKSGIEVQASGVAASFFVQPISL
jgi:hypothetical protein